MKRITPLLAALSLVTVSAGAVGLCELELQRANQTMSRIYREWPLRPSGEPVDKSVQHIASQLARRSGQDGNRRWRTHIVRDRNLNAFSVGDGHVFITEGMLDFVASEAELAALIAHEFGHHLAGHFCTPGPKRGFWGSLFGGNDDTKRSRQRVGSLTALVDPELEREADRIATRILDKAGYDAHAELTLAVRIARSQSTAHFQYRHRIDALNVLLADRKPFVPPAPDSIEFQRMKENLAPSNHGTSP